MMVILFIIVMIVYLILPAPLQIIICIANFFLPDTIPVIDEVVMTVGVIKKLGIIARIWEWAGEHKVLAIIIGILLLGILITGIILFLNYV